MIEDFSIPLCKAHMFQLVAINTKSPHAQYKCDNAFILNIVHSPVVQWVFVFGCNIMHCSAYQAIKSFLYMVHADMSSIITSIKF